MTISKDKDALKSCTKNCGYGKNKYGQDVIASVPLPSCKENCWTTSKESNALDKCEKNCYDKL